jgi:hypothetical protein
VTGRVYKINPTDKYKYAIDFPKFGIKLCNPERVVTTNAIEEILLKTQDFTYLKISYLRKDVKFNTQ